MPSPLNAEEYLALQEMLGHGALMSGLRKLFAIEETQRLEGMRAEALGPQVRTGEIVKYAAESRVFSEWERILKNRMEQLAPQRR